MEAWGHTLTALIGNLPNEVGASESLVNCAKILDKHYIPTRYPNGFVSIYERGVPGIIKAITGLV